MTRPATAWPCQRCARHRPRPGLESQPAAQAPDGPSGRWRRQPSPFSFRLLWRLSAGASMCRTPRQRREPRDGPQRPPVPKCARGFHKQPDERAEPSARPTKRVPESGGRALRRSAKFLGRRCVTRIGVFFLNEQCSDQHPLSVPPPVACRTRHVGGLAPQARAAPARPASGEDGHERERQPHRRRRAWLAGWLAVRWERGGGGRLFGSEEESKEAL
mmetsp:Transcript_25720/g.83071  ORF Transcript_25720/g.83071 Transcript_25720/m.83071 type:complete len:217 (+) Transcript_25720:1017-1667(+)